MACWRMPLWMERYRTRVQTGGWTVEEGMNDPHTVNPATFAIKRQVAMLIALREQGYLKHVKPSDCA